MIEDDRCRFESLAWEGKFIESLLRLCAAVPSDERRAGEGSGGGGIVECEVI